MAKKKTILTDSFERITELGKTSAKKTAKAVKNIVQDVGTAKGLEKLVTGYEKTFNEKSNDQNHTPLDVDKLKTHYEQQDKQKMEVLKTHLFRLSKQEEQKINAQRKQEREQKKQQEFTEEEEKKKKEEEIKKRLAESSIPKGKERRSIFSPKKKAQQEHAETRPAVGKQ